MKRLAFGVGQFCGLLEQPRYGSPVEAALAAEVMVGGRGREMFAVFCIAVCQQNG